MKKKVSELKEETEFNKNSPDTAFLVIDKTTRSKISKHRRL